MPYELGKFSEMRNSDQSEKVCCITKTLQAYSNILKILQPKKENFQIENSDIFHISA